MDNLKVKANAMIDEIDFVDHINKIPYYSKELKESVIDIVKDDIRFQTEHNSVFFEKEDTKKEYFSFWLEFIDALVHKEQCELGIIEYPKNNDSRKKVLVTINLVKTNAELAIDILDSFWSFNQGYLGSFRYDSDLITWVINGTEFYIELSDQ